MKKRLTINRVAGAGLRANKRGYLSLAAGIMLSILLIATLCLCVQGVLLAEEAKVHERYGYGEIFIFDSGTPDNEVMATGWFDQLGHIELRAHLPIYSDAYLGCYDEEGLALMNRRAEEGRLPEKFGEIAIEQWQLDLMETKVQIGDAIELELMPVDGMTETRTYTLVGVLNNQALNLAPQGTVDSSYINLLPSLIVHADDAKFATGRTVRHQVMSLSGAHSQYDILMDYYDSDDFFAGLVMGMDRTGEMMFYPSVDAILATDYGMIIVLMAMLIGSLLLACCVGIAGAMEGQLLRKTEEIGMLRAVGATRRQIRRIFGRESWMIALIVSPLSVGIACVIAWAGARLWPEQLVFRPTWQILIPILLLSMLMILLSSGLPLRRASKIMPMQVIRDTATLRKVKRMKSRRNFKPAQLISQRQLKLHPGRLIAPAVLIALMMLVIMTASSVMLDSLDGYFVHMPEFELSQYMSHGVPFADVMLDRPLTDGDISQLLSVDMVESVSVTKQHRINLLLDEPAAYLAPDESFWQTQNYHLSEKYWDEEDEPFYHSDILAHQTAQKALKTDKLLAQVYLTIMDVDAAGLGKYVADGEINLDALNSGREVLVYAPDYFYIAHSDGSATMGNDPKPGQKYDALLKNDFFTAGMTLDLLQLWLRESEVDALNHIVPIQEESFYAQMDSVRTQTTVGAVLKGSIADYDIWDIGLITTEAGARALGLCTDKAWTVDVYLEDTPDMETEERIEKRLSQIGYRSGLEIRNYLERRREGQANSQQLTMVLTAVAIVFLSIAVGLITGSISRSIRADVRKLGTLRAVGADARVLAGCYRGQIFLSFGLGVGLAAIAFAAMNMSLLPLVKHYGIGYLLGLVAIEAVFVGIALCACLLILNRSISEVTKQSIIENIREL